MRAWPSLVLFIIWLPVAALAADLHPLTVETASGPRTFQVEVVDTPRARAQGLMDRPHLPQDQGMLFDFHLERRVSFWMKNTLIPLDMLFADNEGRIVHIHHMAKPHDRTGIPSTLPVRYVLEINGGLSRILGISIGDRIQTGQRE